jgi:hypothetical protein
MVSENNPEEVPNILKSLESVKRIYKIEFGNEGGIINFGALCGYLGAMLYISDKLEEGLHILICSIVLSLGFIILVCISLRIVSLGLDTEKKIDVIARSLKIMEENSCEKSYDEGNIYERAATIAGFVVAIILCFTMIIYGFNSKLPYFLTLSIGIVIFLLVILYYRNK